MQQKTRISTNNALLCQAYLATVYADISATIVNPEQKQISDSNGEVLSASIQTLISSLSLTEKDIFLDLGAGVGKVVSQVFVTSAVKEARGIELSPSLYQCSLQAALQIQKELPGFYEGGRQLIFQLGDFFETSIMGTTVVFINSTCFSQPMLRRLTQLIETIPSIHTVLTLRPLVAPKRFSFCRTIRIECSWDSALCYVYLSN